MNKVCVYSDSNWLKTACLALNKAQVTFQFCCDQYISLGESVAAEIFIMFFSDWKKTMNCLAEVRELLPSAKILVLLDPLQAKAGRLEALCHGAAMILSTPVIAQEIHGACTSLARYVIKQDLRVLKVGAAELVYATGEVNTPKGLSVQLRKKEAELLRVLGHYSNQVVSRDTLINHVWGESLLAPCYNTIDVYIRKLRSKLVSLGVMIETIRGFGYRLRLEM